MACDNCDCGKDTSNTVEEHKAVENTNEIDMTSMWAPRRDSAVPENGNARGQEVRAQMVDQCPGISDANCCQASQKVLKQGHPRI